MRRFILAALLALVALGAPAEAANALKHKYVSTVADSGDPNEVGPSEWNDEHVYAGGTTDGQCLMWKDAETDNVSWSANFEESSTGDYTLVDQNKACFREGTGGGTNEVCVSAPATLAADRACTLEDDSTPFDSCITAAAAPDIDAVTGQSSWDTAATKKTADLTIDGVEVDFEAGAAEGYPRLAQSTTAPTGDCDAGGEAGRLYFDTDADTDGQLQVCKGAGGWKAVGGGGSSKPFLTFTAPQAFLPVSNFATQDTRNTHPVLDFDAATDECAYFGGVVPNGYAGGGLTVDIVFLATTATSGTVGWLTRFERHQDDAQDLDSDSFGTQKSSSTTVADVSGEPQYVSHAHASGAEIDSLAAGESFRLEVCRDADGSVVTDDAAGDGELYKIAVREP